VELSELCVGDPVVPAGGPALSLLNADHQVYEQARWQLVSVDPGRGRGHNVSDGYVEACSKEPSGQSGGVHHPKGPLRVPLGAEPLMPRDHQLANVVDVDEGRSTQPLGQGAAGRGFSGGWASGQNQRPAQEAASIGDGFEQHTLSVQGTRR